MTTPLEVQLVLGRLLRMLNRPYQPTDDRDYQACRAIIMDHARKPYIDTRPNYARDQNKGAQGD